MLSYRHAYHAGNPADVSKHAVLMVLLEAMCRKPTPLLYMETHAGAGTYSLHAPRARKLAEHARGIARLQAAAELDPVCSRLLELLRPHLQAGHYPGSPRIAADLLRAQDAMLLCELHPSDFPVLSAHLGGRARTTLMHTDGYAALAASLPPGQRRGLVLIDPAYEQRDEPRRMCQALRRALRRFAHGVYALWYPLDERGIGSVLRRDLLAMGCAKLLLAECRFASPRTAGRLQGSGMLIVNPPFRCDEQIVSAFACLSRVCAEHDSAQTGHTVRWLVGEKAAPASV
ncbi:MAG: 23S rRNA (adenine(2030)-N(6))-methyltransferase RlmJ [Gammaproteobacteria bacterium]|nr:23S rRNA (adenine(2030)-N(6))-methyltransferase RlmJ [Gammaproteobacteria bacterium]